MTAPHDQIPGDEPNAIQALLPWYANGTLSAQDRRRVEEALARDTALVAELAAIEEEAAATIHLNETLGAPSPQAMHKLFAAIDAEPARHTGVSLSARIAAFVAGLSPRALTAAAAALAVVVVVQAGVIGKVLVEQYGESNYQAASYEVQKPTSGTTALIRFAPEAKASEIADLLASYHASVVDGPKAGMFRIVLGDKPLPNAERDKLIARVQSEKIIGFAASAE
jgi:anti-sigma-K factor RskA